MTGIKWRKKVIVMKRRVAIFLLSMIMIAAIGFGAAAQMDTAIEEENGNSVGRRQYHSGWKTNFRKYNFCGVCGSRDRLL